jgi:hypothetical protein
MSTFKAKVFWAFVGALAFVVIGFLFLEAPVWRYQWREYHRTGIVPTTLPSEDQQSSQPQPTTPRSSDSTASCSLDLTDRVVGQDPAVAAADKSDLLLIVEASRNNDNAGVRALIGSGRVVVLEPGTRVQTECSEGLDFALIKSGKFIGSKLWMGHSVLESQEEFDRQLEIKRKTEAEAKAKHAAQDAAEQKAADARALEQERLHFLLACDQSKNGTSILSKDDLENFQKACEEVRSGTAVATAREELATLARKKERLESLAECDKNDAQIQHQGFALTSQEALRKKCTDVRGGKTTDLHR